METISVFVNKDKYIGDSFQTQPSSREAAKDIPGVGGETLAPVFTHKTNPVHFIYQKLSYREKGPKIMQVDGHNLELRIARGNVQILTTII